VSHVHRLRLSDRIFFVSVNLRRALARLSELEYDLLVEAIRESRQKLHFLFLGYVLMPDHWHTLIWPTYPLTISRVIQDVKWISARSLNRRRHTAGPVWQHQF
jgi:REP element-mobilizing transposase RayT